MSSNLNPIITKPHISNQNTRQVHWLNFKEFLEQYFKVVPSILSYQHFRVNYENPGFIHVKYSAYGEEKKVNILKKM